MAVKLIMGKIREVGAKKAMIGLFIIGVLAGVSVPFADGAGAGSVSAATNSVAQSAAPTSEGAAVSYAYGRISTSDAYPFYITAAFTTAGGLFVYALTYIPVRSKARARSQYASRIATWAKTTY